MLKFNINSADVIEACKDSYEDVKKELLKQTAGLGKAAETHLIKLAKSELGSGHYMLFVGGPEKKNIDLDSPSPTVHIITIKDNAVLIDDGKSIDMKTNSWLFSSEKTKHGKNGRYLVIPFKHGSKISSKTTDPSATAKFEQQLTNRIQEELRLKNKQRKAVGLQSVTMTGIERYPEGHAKAGQPKEGRLHTFDIFGNRKKPSWTDQPLARLNVYQKIQRDEYGEPKLDKKGQMKATRTWMTFRTASDAKPEKFWYPAPPSSGFLQKTAEWVEKEYFEKVLPAILEKWGD